MKKASVVAALVAVSGVGAALMAQRCPESVIVCRGPGVVRVRANVCGSVATIHPALVRESPPELRNCTGADGGRVLVLFPDAGETP